MKITLTPAIGTTKSFSFEPSLSSLPKQATHELLRKILNEEPHNFPVALALADSYMEIDQVEKACQTRLDCATLIFDLVDSLPDNESLEIDVNSQDNLAVIMTIYLSAIDHYSIGDFEMAAAMLEIILEMDVEDHLGANNYLAFTYAALGDNDAVEEQLKIMMPTPQTKELLRTITKHTNNPKTPVPDSVAKLIENPNDDQKLMLEPLSLTHKSLFNK